jgi:LacI family transcriptional regulator
MVSYVLNNNTKISVPDETRQRILDAIDGLGYVTNKAAQNLRTQRTNMIAIIVPDITNPFHTVFARGVQRVVREQGYEVIMFNTDRNESDERSSLLFLQQGWVDGAIITSLHLQPEELLPVLDKHVPLVVQGPNIMPDHLNGHPLDSLYVDDIAAAETAVDYLFEQGHTRIGMIAGKVGTPPRLRREKGYRQAHQHYNIEVEEALIMAWDFKEEEAYYAMQELLQVEPPVTAVFCASDLLAIGALTATREANLRVPEDIAIIGYDDIPIARLVSPPLTTIAQFQETMGQRAAEMLLARLNDEAPANGLREKMPFELIRRGSA